MTTLTPSMLPVAPRETEYMNAEEFIAKYGDYSGVELVRGRVVWPGLDSEDAMPGFEHGEICTAVAAILREFVKARQLGRVASNDPFVRIEPNGVLGADVVYLSYADYPKTKPSPKGVIDPPLDLVVEVRSPSDTMAQLERKAERYLTAGVRVVVLIDPVAQAAFALRGNETENLYFDTDHMLTLPDILPGFAVPVKAFFD